MQEHTGCTHKATCLHVSSSHAVLSHRHAEMWRHTHGTHVACLTCVYTGGRLRWRCLWMPCHRICMIRPLTTVHTYTDFIDWRWHERHGHLRASSRVGVSLWRFRFDKLENCLEHISHWKCFSSVWRCRRDFKQVIYLKVLGHWPQANGLTLPCLGICLSNALWEQNCFPHLGQRFISCFPWICTWVKKSWNSLKSE